MNLIDQLKCLPLFIVGHCGELKSMELGGALNTSPDSIFPPEIYNCLTGRYRVSISKVVLSALGTKMPVDIVQ
jgi:hypothetical protein